MIENKFPVLEIRKDPVHDIMLECIRSTPQRTALVNGLTGKSYSYSDFDGMVVRVASGLHRMGVSKGDIVIVFAPNCIEFIASVIGIIANGAVATFANPSYTAYELEHALKVTKPSWILAASSLLGTAQEAVGNVNASIRGTIVIHQGTSAYPEPSGSLGSTIVPFEVLMADDGTWYPSEVEIDPAKDVAFIFFSSGTTGLPKGVMLSHYNVVSMMSVLANAFENDPLHGPDEQPIVVSFLPLYHVYGLIGVTLLSLASNHKVILLPRFQPQSVLSCIAKYKVTLAPLVPPVLVFLSKYPDLSKYDLSSLRRVNSGAAPLTADTERDFRRVAKYAEELKQGYGMTETTLAAIVNPPGYKPKSGSVGILLPNTFAQVIDPESKKALGPKQRGEICLKGPQIMLGYINDPSSTQATIDSEGWLHTGDIGYYDEDGYFFVVDRIKELIKFKGLQVAPAELESLVLTHPEVADVAVIGIPDKEAGELPKAFVVRKQGSQITADDVKKFVAGKVSSFKHLRGGVEFVEKIPKSETGKILRRMLRQGAPLASKL